MLDSIFGGSSSSRLFREVREKRGLAYAVGSYNEQYTDSGLVATYVGTREDNVEEACSIIGAELARLRSEPVSGEELARAKESVKGRLVLSSESTAARMTRISRATLFGLPIDSLDEMLAKVDAVSVDDLTELAAELYGAERLSAACVGRDEERFREALGPVSESAGRRRDQGRRRRAPPGGWARPSARRSRAPTTWSWPAKADPALGVELADVLGDADVVVDFTTPDTALANVRACLEAGVHAVVGTTGFDLDALREAAEASGEANCFVAPNFAIGAVLLMEAAQTIAPPHARVRDRRAAPRPQARRPLGHGEAHRRADRRGRRQRPRADPLGAAARPGRPPGGRLRRRGPDADASATTRSTAAPSCPACCSRCARSAACPTASRSASRSCSEAPVP